MEIKGGLGCFIGLPASGKTTWANKLQTEKLALKEIFPEPYKSCNFTVEVISFDNEITFLDFDDLQNNEWKNQRNKLYNLVNTKIEHHVQGRKSDEFLLILLDDNFFYKSMRRIYYSLANKFDFIYFQMLVSSENLSISQLIERDQLRANSVGAETIIKMTKILELPDTNSKWEKASCNLSSEDFSKLPSEALEGVIQTAFLIRKEKIEKRKNDFKNQETNANDSEKHNIDIFLRKIISTQINKLRTTPTFANLSKQGQGKLLQDFQKILGENKKKMTENNFRLQKIEESFDELYNAFTSTENFRAV